MKKLVVILFVFLVSCASTPIIKGLGWSRVDTTIVGTYIDSTDIEYHVYMGDSITYDLLTITQDTTFDLLQDDGLYVDSTYYFYLKAYRISVNKFGESSDTVSGFLPILEPGKPYNFKFLKVD